jgi:hypothetical protein
MSTATTPIPYATDEDIALRASADFPLLCPRDQKLASATDGVLFASAPWTLTSATVDFQALGVAAGQIVQLERAGQMAAIECLVVVGTAPGSVTLRRKGQPAGVGMPPGTASGLSGVTFRVATLGPQIALASADVNRRFGISDGLYPGRSPSELADPSEIRDAVVLTVLYRQYLDASRVMGGLEGGSADHFAAKARAVKAELDDLLARLAVHWNRSFDRDALGPATTRFGTRMSR